MPASPRRGTWSIPREGYASALRGATTAAARARTVAGMETTIEVRGLTKRFGGETAVDDLSFTVAAGRVTGFVGPNGAGKSTTMRMILGLDAPDAGCALVNGRPYAALRQPLRHV